MRHRQLVLGAILAFLVALLVGLVAAGQPAPGPPPTMPVRSSDLATVLSDVEPIAYLPLLQSPPELQPWISTQDRSAVRDFYLGEYLASEGIDSEWTGNRGACDPGVTSQVFRQAVVRRINFFRSMAGIPALAGLNEEYSSKAQDAALMMSVNRSLSHDPPSSWDCYSGPGHEGAGSSNLYLGVYGPAAISGYIRDPGPGNFFVGHRRWILYPQTRYMGTGDIPPGDGQLSSNALWVFDLDNMWGPRPVTRDGFVAWPPPGHVPYQIVYPRWSFAYPSADFGNASVAMTRDGQPLNVTMREMRNGYGENTLVWEPDEQFYLQPQADISYQVTIDNLSLPGFPQPITYEVTVFDPGN